MPMGELPVTPPLTPGGGKALPTVTNHAEERAFTQPGATHDLAAGQGIGELLAQALPDIGQALQQQDMHSVDITALPGELIGRQQNVRRGLRGQRRTLLHFACPLLHRPPPTRHGDDVTQVVENEQQASDDDDPQDPLGKFNGGRSWLRLTAGELELQIRLARNGGSRLFDLRGRLGVRQGRPEEQYESDEPGGRDGGKDKRAPLPEGPGQASKLTTEGIPIHARPKEYSTDIGRE